MLAWLLTPTDRHGLRNLLLTNLLSHYDSKHGNPHPPQVRPMVRTVGRFSRGRDNREADVVVWGQGFTLVIEMLAKRSYRNLRLSSMPACSMISALRSVVLEVMSTLTSMYLEINGRVKLSDCADNAGPRRCR